MLGADGGLSSVLVALDKDGEITCPLSNRQVSAKVSCLVTNDANPFLSGLDKSLMGTATIPAGLKAALLVFLQTRETTEEPQGGELASLHPADSCRC